MARGSGLHSFSIRKMNLTVARWADEKTSKEKTPRRCKHANALHSFGRDLHQQQANYETSQEKTIVNNDWNSL